MFKLSEDEKKLIIHTAMQKPWNEDHLDLIIWDIFRTRMAALPVMTSEDLPVRACASNGHEPEYNILRPQLPDGTVITHRCKYCFIGMIPKTFQIETSVDNQK